MTIKFSAGTLSTYQQASRMHNSGSQLGTIETGGFGHVVFLGTYNADPFRHKIEKWLPKLDLDGCTLHVSDNSSTDSTSNWLPNLLDSLAVPVSYVRQESNLGGYGNLEQAINYLWDSTWITTLHQDDEYRTNHVQAHRQAIHQGPPNLGMVWTEARSIDLKGRPLGYPRASWLIDGASPPTDIFLAHLRSHVFPFSGATFLRRALFEYPVPAGENAFPDTELVLKMAPKYAFSSSDSVTVTYLENPFSESHSLLDDQRQQGVCAALRRVFTHENFGELISLVPPSLVPAFSRELVAAIHVRLPDSKLAGEIADLAINVLVESISKRTEYQELALSSRLRSAQDQPIDGGTNAKTINYQGDSRARTMSRVRQILASPRMLRVVGHVPLVFRRTLFRIGMKLPFFRLMFPSFDFTWRSYD